MIIRGVLLSYILRNEVSEFKLEKILLKQPMMFKVLYALLPIVLFAVFLFGWRVLLLVSVTNLFAFISEYLFVRNTKKKISSAVFVTGTLLGLILPPTLPFWMAAVGAVVAIVFGKMVFGGFGLNIFNPAIVGRTFLYVTFANEMTVSWLETFRGFPGGLTAYINVDAVTQATAMRESITISIADTFWGFIPGSIGETSAILIIIAGIYLIFTKTAKWQHMVSTVISFLVFTVILYPGDNTLFHLFTGGILFGSVFMVTDPISNPKNKYAIWINGLLVGFLTVFIRKYALWPGGFMFALLIANSVMPIIEYLISRKAK